MNSVVVAEDSHINLSPVHLVMKWILNKLKIYIDQDQDLHSHLFIQFLECTVVAMGCVDTRIFLRAALSEPSIIK